MEKIKVCVTGSSSYVGSWLIKKLLEKGYIVRATLRNLDDKSKIGLLKALPNAETGLELFQADIYNPKEFEPAIEGCQFVFHLATPMQHNPNSQYKDTAEAAVSGVRSIADCCMRSQTVKRLIYTASVTASSPLKEDGTGYKDIWDESCWTPLDLSLTYANDYSMGYAKSKKLAEIEALRYNEPKNASKLEVVTLACGVVAGDTILPYTPESVECILSQLTGNAAAYCGLQFLQEILGAIPIVHIEDVCEAHIFCMEKPSLKGRFLCAVSDQTLTDIASYYKENYPGIEIPNKFIGGQEKGSKSDFTKLKREGFEYKYDLKKILDDSVDCGKRLPGSSGQSPLVHISPKPIDS